MEPMLIDLGNDFFIVKIGRGDEVERVLTEGPWLIGENYLHIQRWGPNFSAYSATILSLPVWIYFPELSAEYSNVEWLCRAGDQIGKIIKVDDITMVISRDKFARVCVEADLQKHLRSHYRMGGKVYHIQYEGQSDLCFSCGKYGTWKSSAR